MTASESSGLDDIVRRYFAAWAARRPTDDVATRTRAAADALFDTARVPLEERTVELRRADVEHMGEHAAVVAVECTLVRRIGDRSFEASLTGPVELRREDDAWKVAVFHRNGRPVVPLLLAGPPVRAGGVALMARAVEFRFGDSTGVLLEARNEAGDDARLVGVKTRSHVFIAWGRVESVLGSTVPAHTTVFREALLPPLPKEPRRLELSIRLEQAGREFKARLQVLP